jgi:hypothetical protein
MNTVDKYKGRIIKYHLLHFLNIIISYIIKNMTYDINSIVRHQKDLLVDINKKNNNKSYYLLLLMIKYNFPLYMIGTHLLQFTGLHKLPTLVPKLERVLYLYNIDYLKIAFKFLLDIASIHGFKEFSYYDQKENKFIIKDESFNLQNMFDKLENVCKEENLKDYLLFIFLENLPNIEKYSETYLAEIKIEIEKLKKDSTKKIEDLLEKFKEPLEDSRENFKIQLAELKEYIIDKFLNTTQINSIYEQKSYPAEIPIRGAFISAVARSIIKKHGTSDISAGSAGVSPARSWSSGIGRPIQLVIGTIKMLDDFKPLTRQSGAGADASYISSGGASAVASDISSGSAGAGAGVGAGAGSSSSIIKYIDINKSPDYIKINNPERAISYWNDYDETLEHPILTSFYNEIIIVRDSGKITFK